MTNRNGPCAGPRKRVETTYPGRIVETNRPREDADDVTVNHIRPQKEDRDREEESPEEVRRCVLSSEDHEDLSNASPSVRAAVLGKGERPRADSSSEGEERTRDAEKKEEEEGVDFGQDYSEERCIPVRVPTIRPSEKEIARHNLTHVPFRPWCEVCVRGAANANPP